MTDKDIAVKLVLPTAPIYSPAETRGLVLLGSAPPYRIGYKSIAATTFDQSLNTTDDVRFKSVSIGGLVDMDSIGAVTTGSSPYLVGTITSDSQSCLYVSVKASYHTVPWTSTSNGISEKKYLVYFDSAAYVNGPVGSITLNQSSVISASISLVAVGAAAEIRLVGLPAEVVNWSVSLEILSCK